EYPRRDLPVGRDVYSGACPHGAGEPRSRPCARTGHARAAERRVTYFRATDPFPLESAEHTKLHEFYTRLGEGRLVTTRCGACGATAWPPRGFCGECASDVFSWVELARGGTVHALPVQDTGLPAGLDGDRKRRR